MYGEQAKLVKALLKRGGTLSYDELQREMGYGGQHLSGILSPITRNAQRATEHPKAYAVYWDLSGGGVREYHIDTNLLPLLQRLVTAEPQS